MQELIINAKAEENKFKISTSYETGNKLDMVFYMLSAGKTNFPHHFNSDKEEVFYIISGSGLWRTPTDEKTVTTGDIIRLPSNSNGTYELANSYTDGEIVYINILSSSEITFDSVTSDFRISF